MKKNVKRIACLLVILAAVLCLSGCILFPTGYTVVKGTTYYSTFNDMNGNYYDAPSYDGIRFDYGSNNAFNNLSSYCGGYYYYGWTDADIMNWCSAEGYSSYANSAVNYINTNIETTNPIIVVRRGSYVDFIAIQGYNYY